MLFQVTPLNFYVPGIGNQFAGGTFADFQALVSSLGAVKNVYYGINQYTGYVDAVFATFTSDFHSASFQLGAGNTTLTTATVLAAYPHAISTYLNSISDAA